MIRAFVCGWTGEPRGEVVSTVEANIFEMFPPPAAFSCANIYPDADQDGLPDGQHVLVIVHSENANIELLDSVEGVYMFPPHPFDTPIAEIPQETIDEVLMLCSTEGWMPVEPLFSATTYGDCLKLLASHFKRGFISFGKCETERAAEFG